MDPMEYIKVHERRVSSQTPARFLPFMKMTNSLYCQRGYASEKQFDATLRFNVPELTTPP